MPKQQAALQVDDVCRGNRKRSAVRGIGICISDDHPCNMSEPIIGGARKTNSLAKVAPLRRALELANALRSK